MSESDDVPRMPLNTIERYLVRSEQAGADLVFVSEADFDGRVDAQLFSQAVQSTLVHHPLLHSVIVRAGNNWCWQPTSIESVFEQRHLTRLPEPYGDTIEAIDLRVRPGVRIHLTTTDDGHTRIVGHYHHACADGQGGARFFRDVCAGYAMLLQGVQPKLNVEAELLKRREQFQPPDGKPPIGLTEGLRNLWVTVRGRNARFAQLYSDSENPTNRPVVIEATMESAVTSRIRDYLRDNQCVLNDFALAAAFIMLAQTSLGSNRNRYLTILNPVDLRGWNDRRLPAANRVGFALIRRRAGDCSSGGGLMRSLDEQMRYVRCRGIAAELMKGIGLVERIPGCVALFERTRRFTATALLTCMSNLSIGRRHGLVRSEGAWQLGAARVRRVSVAGPLARDVPLTITVIDSGGKISITMRGCSRYFTAPLLHRLVEGWRSGCETICQSTSK